MNLLALIRIGCLTDSQNVSRGEESDKSFNLAIITTIVVIWERRNLTEYGF
jgi:hypothetical protein